MMVCGALLDTAGRGAVATLLSGIITGAVAAQPTSYMPVNITEDFPTTMHRMQAGCRPAAQLQLFRVTFTPLPDKLNRSPTVDESSLITTPCSFFI